MAERKKKFQEILKQRIHTAAATAAETTKRTIYKLNTDIYVHNIYVQIVVCNSNENKKNTHTHNKEQTPSDIIND